MYAHDSVAKFSINAVLKMICVHVYSFQWYNYT